MKEIVMNNLQSVTLAVASAAAVGAAGLGVAAATANARPAAASQAAPASSLGGGQVKANERVVEAFLQDVINEHNGNDVAGYLTPDMVWYGGTVGAGARRANVARLFASAVAAFPASHITIDDLFGHGDQAFVRPGVACTQHGAILAVP